jgi:uncharacterized delta-60 repeat protein
VSSTARPRLLLAGLCVTTALAAPAAASGGRGPRPDRSFGAGRGFVTTSITGTTALAYAATIAPGGQIVIAGQASPPSGNGQVVVARYTRGGRLDRSFASRGIFESAFPTADAPFLASAIARDRRTGKLVVAGGYGMGSMLVMRLTAGGRLDRTFGTHRSGFTTVTIGGIANALAIQPDGRILLGGSNANRNGRPFVVARFTSKGVLDRSFGRGGIVQALFWNPTAASSAGVNSLAPTRDGGMIATGHIDYIGGNGGGSGGHGAAGVFRLTRRGVPARSFGSSGHVQVTFFTRTRVPESWYPCAATVDRRGRIAVTGGGGTHHFALFTARLTARGTLDRSYGRARDGRAVIPGIGGNAITTCGATSTPAGALTIAVQSRITQLLPSGVPDRRFATRGVFGITRPRGVFVNALAAAGSGRLVAAGSAGNSIYVARWLR